VDRALTAVRSAGFLFQDATLRNHSQDLAGARKSLEEALKLAPTDRATLNLMGAVMAQLGQSKEFVATVRETAAKNPGSTSMQLTLGRQLLGTGDNAGARAAFEAARRTGDAADAEVELAAMDMRAGAMPAAKQRLTELVKTRDGVPARMLLAEIQGRAGAHDGAVQQYLKVLQLEPGNAMAMNNMAETLASGLNKLDDAVFWSQKALALAPSNPVVEDTLGWTLYRQGKYDAALPHLQKSLKDLERPVAHYHLAAVLARTGDKARAQKEFEAAVKQAPASTEKAAAELALAGRAAK
jgi:tetratricopeptide (TPR) repeat protein